MMRPFAGQVAGGILGTYLQSHALRAATTTGGASSPAGSNQPWTPFMRKNRSGVGVVVEMPTGPHLMLDQLTLDPIHVSGTAAPVLTPEEARSWALDAHIPPTQAELDGLESRRQRIDTRPLDRRLPLASRGAEVLLRYPNGELHATRHKTSGATLRVGGHDPLILAADQAERLGLADWMPFTRPEYDFPIVVPGIPRTKKDALRQALGVAVKVAPYLRDSLLGTRAPDLYRPRVDASANRATWGPQQPNLR